MLSRSNSSSSSRVGTPPSASSSSSSEVDEAPSTHFRDLPHETIALIGMKLRNPSDAFHFLLSCKHVKNSKFFKLCAPDLVETRIDALKNVETQKRATAAVQLALGLRKRLGPVYLGCILDKINVPEESDLVFLLHQEKKYVAAVVLEATNRKQLLTDVARRKGVIEAAGKELRADIWEHDLDGIKYFLAGVRESFAGKERLICRCYLGLWQWYSKNEKDDKLVAHFALELLRTLEPAKPFVKLSVLLSMLEFSRLAPQLAKSPELLAAVHSLAKQLPVPRGLRSDRLFTALCNTFHGCQNERILKLHLQLFSPLLARQPGQHTEAGIGWLVQTIAQASGAGVSSKEIRGLIPRDIFLRKGRSYVIGSAMDGTFSSSALHNVEHA